MPYLHPHEDPELLDPYRTGPVMQAIMVGGVFLMLVGIVMALVELAMWLFK